MLSRLKEWIWSDSNLIWEDKRGAVTHKYIFMDTDEDWRSRCISYNHSDEATIEYNIPKFFTRGNTVGEIYVYLVEDTLHELTHWATDESDYSNQMSTHWENWTEVLYDEIDYTNDDFELEY